MKRPHLPHAGVVIRKAKAKPAVEPEVLPPEPKPATSPTWPAEAIAAGLARVEREPPPALAQRRGLGPDTPPAAVYLASLTSETSRRSMRDALDRIARTARKDSDAVTFPWWQIRYQQALACRSELVRSFAPRTANRMLAALRGVLRACARLRVQGPQGEVPLLSAQDLSDALAALRSVPASEYSEASAGRMLSKAEKRKLREAATDPRDRALLEVAMVTGLRRFELAGLDLEHWDKAQGELTVRGKGRKLAQVPLLPSAVAHLEAWLKVRGTEPGPLFVGYDGQHQPRHTRMSVNGVGAVLKALQEAAGIAHFTTHDLRRTLISELWDADVDASTVQKLARHANMQTTASYDRRGQKAKRKAMERWEKAQQDEEE
jgi:integrase